MDLGVLMEKTELLVRLKALGDETRLKLLDLLLTHDLCVGALAGRLGISEAAVSQHLQILRRAGLISGEKRGYWTHYTVQRAALRQLAERLESIADQPLCLEGCCRRSAPKVPFAAAKRGSEMCRCCCEQSPKLKDKPEAGTLEQVQEGTGK